MPSHKFHVGEIVPMRPATSLNIPGGDSGAEPEYRIRSENEPYERVARQSELTKA
jgi:hypothetical protein